MDTNLLCAWLGLPRGKWPPNDRALLGLPPGPVDPSDAESNALARMEKLRQQQLVHPDLVTEGMNRLAQALIAVTTGETLDGPDAFPDVSLEPSHGGPGIAPPPKRPEPVILDAEVVELPVKPKPGATPIRRATPQPMPALKVKVGPPKFPTDIQQGMRDLAAAKEYLRAWELFAPTAGNPANKLATAPDVSGFLEAVVAWRAASGALPAYLAGTSGSLLTAIIRQPRALAVFKALGPAQRKAVALDWSAAGSAIRERALALRDSLQKHGPPAAKPGQ